MAETLVSFVVEATLSKVVSNATEQINLAWGFNKEDLELFLRVSFQMSNMYVAVKRLIEPKLEGRDNAESN
ncbi:hypothetical protein COLO4_25172 [Corchorus olitorius]|uniref:Uncharacterized protein n=1 Tax=Corchorus olitorius TaxID=93759 RepID=A0A1R3I4C6_9ROSI|nr:hypothetical protein COLO4_25172 [Corchorus olitorius]